MSAGLVAALEKLEIRRRAAAAVFARVAGLPGSAFPAVAGCDRRY